MSLGVNTNISSLTAQRALSTADKDLATAMERLSTGKRINTASDDAAGMAIAARLTSQINGLNQAVKNANSAIALTQTIDGALDEVTDMLQRARELSVQSASDTLSSRNRPHCLEHPIQRSERSRWHFQQPADSNRSEQLGKSQLIGVQRCIFCHW